MQDDSEIVPGKEAIHMTKMKDAEVVHIHITDKAEVPVKAEITEAETVKKVEEVSIGDFKEVKVIDVHISSQESDPKPHDNEATGVEVQAEAKVEHKPVDITDSQL